MTWGEGVTRTGRISIGAVVALGVSAGLFSVSAKANGKAAEAAWTVTSSPATAPDGKAYCSLRSAEKRPLIEFTRFAADGRTTSFIGVISDSFSSVPAEGNATLRFPSGEAVTLRYHTVGPGIAFPHMSGRDFHGYLLQLRAPGTLTVELGDKSERFALTDVARMVILFRRCDSGFP